MRLNIGRRGRSWALDLSSVPAESTQSGSRFFAFFVIVFALLWGGFPVVGLIHELEAGRVRPDLLLFLIFPAIGIGILLFGLHQLLWRRTVAFDGAAFTVTERGLRGERQWREALSAYLGVVRRTRRVRTKNSSYTLYMVDLAHGDSDRVVNLYTDTSDRNFRQIWEDYARRLKLPALEDAAGGITRRDAADLDKSVGELIGEGKVDIDYDTLSRPAEGLAVGFEGDDVLITRTGPQSTWWGVLIAVLFPLVFVGVGLFAPDLHFFGRVAFAGMGLLFETLFVIGVVGDLTSRKRLRVGPDGVLVCAVSGRGENKGKHIGSQAIESVTVAAEAGKWGSWVVIAGDRKTLKFGNGLPRPSLDFAMNTVLAKIAETQRRGPRKRAAS